MSTFSPRETDVVRLICAADTDKEIAAALNLSHDTVRGYTKAVYFKAGVHNRVALVLWCLRHYPELIPHDQGTESTG